MLLSFRAKLRFNSFHACCHWLFCTLHVAHGADGGGSGSRLTGSVCVRCTAHRPFASCFRLLTILLRLNFAITRIRYAV